MCSNKLHESLFEETLKSTVWAKEINGKFVAMIGDDEVSRKYYSHDEAYEKAKEIQILSLADHAAFIVGDGNEYRGVIGKFLSRGN